MSDLFNPSFSGGATLEFEVELLDLTKKPFFRMPQGNGFYTAVGIIVVAVVVVYELYKRARKQGEELKGSRKREKGARRGSGKSQRKKD